MEIYTPEQNSVENQNGPENQNDQKRTFAVSELNETTPLWKKIVLFATGFLGLQIIALIVQLILMATPLFDRTQMNFTILGSTLVNFITYLLICGLLVLICYLGKDGAGKKIFIPFKKKETYTWGFIGFGLVFIINIFFSLIYNFLPDFEQNANQLGINEMLDAYPFLVFIMTAIMAPIVEEITYRAGLCDLIGKRNRWLGIILSAILFGLIHFDFSSILSLISPAKGFYDSVGNFIEFTSEELVKMKEVNLHALFIELENLPIYILSGISLAFVYCKTGTLSTSIFAHCLVNSYSFLGFIVNKAMQNGGSDSITSAFRILFR